jgi:hypothetical protein
VVVKRNPNGTFGKSTWVDLNYPGVEGWTSNDSVAGNQVVGIAIGKTTDASTGDSNLAELSFQATVNVGVRSAGFKGRHGRHGG